MVQVKTENKEESIPAEQIQQKKSRKTTKTAKPDVATDDIPETPNLTVPKPKRTHIMTDARREAFLKCQEGNKAYRERKKQEKENAQTQTQAVESDV
jgi:hypothetical protein